MNFKEYTNRQRLILEGGAMPGVGPIHIDEIEPTLKALEQDIGIDLLNNTLGSVGKKEFSGDIDIAVDISRDQIPELIENINKSPLISDIAKSSVIMTKSKIKNFDESKTTAKPRTGYVQIDFMLGDPDWLKTYYHSPRETESKYSGSHRNIMIASIAGALEPESSEETIEDGRPVWSKRYMWSPTEGLLRVERRPKPKASGVGYTKQNINDIISGPWTSKQDIADELNLGSPDALDSYETLKAAIEANYPRDVVDTILSFFANNRQIQDMGLPPELERYLK